MQKKLMAWKTKGMNQDLSVSAFNPEFSFENMNLRLSTNEGNTQMSWVNERGTAKMEVHNTEGETSIIGTTIGTAVINHNLVLFTVSGEINYIYKLWFGDNKNFLYIKELYSGKLNMDVNHPLETMTSYESDLVQKVYWTDGKTTPKPNQPRVINIAGTIRKNLDTQFDFIPTLKLEETISVEKQLGATGMFAPGVIQYSFTYYNKYGQESNIFYTTPLQYISYKDRGASPEDKVKNAFKITVTKVDTNFDYLRIYSIQRTSIDGTPICKRVQDIAMESLDWVDEDDHSKGKKASFIDTGTTGESIDPTELLYKGGEIITAQTMGQKDNTLFLGNLKIMRPEIEVKLRNSIKSAVTIQSNTTRNFTAMPVSYGSYSYYNQLTSKGAQTRDSGKTVPCCGFKTGDYYRLGVQFQHESGKWSDPIHITDGDGNDYQVTGKSSSNGGTITIPNIKGSISGGVITELNAKGYKRIRPVVVFPSMLDRVTICQGVVNPTVYTQTHRNDKDIYAQSSWFFRPFQSDDNTVSETTNAPKSRNILNYTQRNIKDNFPVDEKESFNPRYLRKVEIEGDFDPNNQFKIDTSFRTLHSPDIEFDDQLSLIDFTSGTSYKQVGVVNFIHTMSDIDIQTENPTVSNSGAGFMHKAFTDNGAKGIVAGLFYDDYIVDDKLGDDHHLGPYPRQRASAKWLIYPWQSNGSLNNDMNRPANKGIATAVLKKKMISNLRYATTSLNDWNNRKGNGNTFTTYPQLFSGEEDTILKIGDNIYKGNIDTLLMPDNADGKYLAVDSFVMAQITWPVEDWYWYYNDASTPFTSTAWAKLFSRNTDKANENGIRKWVNSYNEHSVKQWVWGGKDIGDDFVDIAIRKSPVRMKYKSTPHLVIPSSASTEDNNQLAIFEIQQPTSHTTRFGGMSADALRENVWIPCGESVPLNSSTIYFYYDYGDTYFQRYDCLKTYAYTREDVNQIVEIGSFMLETHVNIDGRYDRNRGQSNNLNMSPQNFNLLNPVYSQKDNFFSYRIQDDDLYKNNSYPNQITWTKTKQSSADTDMWNNVTLASTLELDGNKGKITSLQRLNDQLICFQDQGISQILYNENTQISTTEGVPIEISNSGKVQGKRYLSDTVGCSNKWSICSTPMGLYFMDSIGKNIFLFNGQLNNLSTSLGFNTWCKNNILLTDGWTLKDFEDFHTVYDNKNQEVLFINKDIALAYSEKFGIFTSFYDYGSAPWLCNLDDEVLWIKGSEIWKHQAGDYCNFFGTQKPYWMTLVGNPEPQTDKIFTNLEFRSCVEGDGELNEETGKFTPTLPFDSLETWDEYQHGIANLSIRNGHNAFKHHTTDNNASLKRKFRIWRCDIPRDNAPLASDAALNVTRFKLHPNDRMRNPWLYLKLQKDADTDKKVEIHDMMMTYFT